MSMLMMQIQALVAIGVEHRLDKAVRVYANLATMLNDKNARPYSLERRS